MAVHRDQIEAAVAKYGDVPRNQLPRFLTHPANPDDFALAMAVVSGLTPGYDENGYVETWPVRLK
jgi:hypothetical protein